MNGKEIIDEEKIEEEKINEEKIGEEKMWCSHCGVKTPIRREGNAGTVKSCNWCGKILADETGTAEEYNQLFRRYQAWQALFSLEKKLECIKKQ